MTDHPFEELIEVKRDGGTHTAQELDRIVLDFTRGVVPDFQMSAWLMAGLLQGLSDEETVWLTDAMVRSGRVVDMSSVPGLVVDKHSTGGVGDTTTLALAPLVAACGAPVGKMSGRGLGFTGGTLDKLESIPGFTVELSADDFVEQVRRVGIAVIAQSPDIDPADKMIYALRDVTATVPSIPYIVGSIVSKKVAGGADAVLLDVKVGSGAFMKTEQDARDLAHELQRVGSELGRSVQCVLTDMNQPLGMAIGNAIEVVEAIETLRGQGPAALTELCLELSGRLLVLGEAASTTDEGRTRARSALEDGSALDMFRTWVETQGGDPRVADDTSLLPQAAFTREVAFREAGYVVSYDAEEVGRSAMDLGAGRSTPQDTIDPAAGVMMHARIGDAVSPGAPYVTLHTNDESSLEAAEERIHGAVRLSADPVTPPPLFHDL